MSSYGVIPLLRDPERDMSYAGAPRTAYVSTGSDLYHPNLTNVADDAVTVGSTFEMGWEQTSCTPKQLKFYKTFGSTACRQGLMPYEITNVHIPELGYFPFKLKLITPRPYALLNLHNLEAIYAYYTRRPAVLEDPRITILIDSIRREERLGADPRFINQIESGLEQYPYMRNLCYDTLCWSAIEQELSRISSEIRRASVPGLTHGDFASRIGSLISPLDVDSGITFPFAYKGPIDPRSNWSSNGPLISLEPTPPYGKPDHAIITDGTSSPVLRTIAQVVESLPLTEFEIDVACDGLGNIYHVDPVWMVDRYMHLVPGRCAVMERDTFHKWIRPLALPLINALWNSLKITRGTDTRWASAQVSIKIMRSVNDEIAVHYFIDNHVTPDVELYFDLALASLTSFGVSESFMPKEPESMPYPQVGYYGPTAEMYV